MNCLFKEPPRDILVRKIMLVMVVIGLMSKAYVNSVTYPMLRT